MNVLKLAVLPLLGLSMFATSALARDRVNVDINIGAYDYVAAPVVTHYPNTVYYGRTPTVIYYGAPTVVQYVPVVTTPNHIGNVRHPNSNYNYYQHWNNGWQGQAWGGSGWRGQRFGFAHGGRGGDRCEQR